MFVFHIKSQPDYKTVAIVVIYQSSADLIYSFLKKHPFL